MKNRYFCEVIQENDDVIKFQMVHANFLSEAVEILHRKYSDIKEWVIKDMLTEVRYSNESS